MALKRFIFVCVSAFYCAPTLATIHHPGVFYKSVMEQVENLNQIAISHTTLAAKFDNDKKLFTRLIVLEGISGILYGAKSAYAEETQDEGGFLTEFPYFEVTSIGVLEKIFLVALAKGSLELENFSENELEENLILIINELKNTGVDTFIENSIKHYNTELSDFVSLEIQENGLLGLNIF